MCYQCVAVPCLLSASIDGVNDSAAQASIDGVNDSACGKDTVVRLIEACGFDCCFAADNLFLVAGDFHDETSSTSGEPRQ